MMPITSSKRPAAEPYAQADVKRFLKCHYGDYLTHHLLSFIGSDIGHVICRPLNIAQKRNSGRLLEWFTVYWKQVQPHLRNYQVLSRALPVNDEYKIVAETTLAKLAVRKEFSEAVNNRKNRTLIAKICIPTVFTESNPTFLPNPFAPQKSSTRVHYPMIGGNFGMENFYSSLFLVA